MPCNLYGKGDNYDGKNSHVIPALMKKFHQAKINGHSTVNIWGSGNQLREFLNSDDLAKGIIHVMNVEKSVFSDITKDSAGVINIGSGEEITIKNLALMIKDVVNFKGKIEFDSSMPDGTPRKILDKTKINALGWKKNIDFEKGLYLAYEDYIDRHG
jgi:GDP-L-fucose synthase